MKSFTWGLLLVVFALVSGCKNPEKLTCPDSSGGAGASAAGGEACTPCAESGAPWRRPQRP